MAKAKDKHLFARCGCRLCIFAPGQRLHAHSLAMPFFKIRRAPHHHYHHYLI